MNISRQARRKESVMLMTAYGGRIKQLLITIFCLALSSPRQLQKSLSTFATHRSSPLLSLLDSPHPPSVIAIHRARLFPLSHPPESSPQPHFIIRGRSNLSSYEQLTLYVQLSAFLQTGLAPRHIATGNSFGIAHLPGMTRDTCLTLFGLGRG